MCAGALFGRLISSCCAQLQRLADFNERPDTADDTFLLAGRGLSYCPSLVLVPAVLPHLLDCAMAGLLVQHRCAHWLLLPAMPAFPGGCR